MQTFSQRQTLVTEAVPDYSLNDLCGGKISWTIATPARGSKLTRVGLRSKDSFAGVASKLILFGSDPSSTTFTENGAFSIHASDIAKVLYVLRVAAADWIDDTGVGNGYWAEKEVNVPLDASPIIYGAFIPGATLNLSATDSLAGILAGERY